MGFEVCTRQLSNGVEVRIVFSDGFTRTSGPFVSEEAAIQFARNTVIDETAEWKKVEIGLGEAPPIKLYGQDFTPDA